MRHASVCTALPLAILLLATTVAVADPPAAIVERGKSATALIVGPERKAIGAAVCVDGAGVFVTNLHLNLDATIDLLLLPGQKDERKVSARVVSASKNPWCSVLVVEGVKDLVAVSPRKAEPIETEQLMLVGYVTRTGDIAEKQPPVRVEITRVRTLHRVGGQLNSLEMDIRIPQFHSGGPLIDDEGRLVGLALFMSSSGNTKTFAIPAMRLDAAIKTPRIVVAAPAFPASIPYAKQHEPIDWGVRVETLGKPRTTFQVQLELSTRPGERRTFPMKVFGNGYRLTEPPVPDSEAKRVTIDLVSDGATLKAEIPDTEFNLDNKPARLSEFDRVERRGGEWLAVKADGTSLAAKEISGGIAAVIHQQIVPLDLSRATSWKVGPPGPAAQAVRYRVLVRDGDATVATFEGTTPIEGVPVEKAEILTLEPQPRSGMPATFLGPPLKGEPKVVELGEPFTAVSTGGGGRYLVLQLARSRKLAVVDVSQGRVVGRIEAPVDEFLFTAGAERLMIALPAQKLLQRWSLVTLKRDQTAAFPGDETVLGVRMGASARNPLFVFDGKEIGLWDVERMVPVPIQGKPIVVRAPGDFRVSAGGQSVVAWDGGGPRASVLRLEGSRGAAIDGFGNGSPTFVSGDGSLIFRQGGSLASWNLKPQAAAAFKGQVLMPCEDPRFFVALPDKPGKASTADLCTTADRRVVMTIEGLEPVGAGPARGLAFGEPRIRYLPSAKLVVVLPESNDRVVLRPFDLHAELKASGREYLFVTSTPPTHFRRGQPFSYQLETLANSEATYALDLGPKGLTISPTGLVQWEAPAQPGPAPVRVAITVRDAAGKEALHVFDLTAE